MKNTKKNMSRRSFIVGSGAVAAASIISSKMAFAGNPQSTKVDHAKQDYPRLSKFPEKNTLLNSAPRGTYRNPRKWDEYGDEGDVYYYPEYKFYFRLEYACNPSDNNWYFPTKPVHKPPVWTFLSGLNLGVTDWMAGIPDSTLLSYMSIPGTHDSCTYKNLYPFVWPWVTTQVWDIHEQLNNGIRFLDLRCGPYSDGNLGMYHGNYDLEVSLLDVLSACKVFLDVHPLETILVRIKKEGPGISDNDFLEKFNENIKDYKSYIWMGNEIPEIGHVRSKIVIISQVSGLSGLSWSAMDIEDYSQGGIFTSYIEKKAELIKEHLVAATSAHKKKENTIFVTFSSINPGTDIFESNDCIASSLNSTIYKYLLDGIGINSDLVNDDIPYLGIIPMDFPNHSSEAIAAIIKFNNNEAIDNSLRVSIFNTKYDNYIYASSILVDDENERRKVVGWETGRDVYQGHWKIIHANDNLIFLFNTHYKEFMYATSSVKNNRRTVCTWVTGIGIDSSCLWELSEYNDGTFSIKNVQHSEYFYASSLNDGDNRRITACWQPGNIVSQAFFVLSPESL